MYGVPPSFTGQGTPWGSPNPASQWAPLPYVPTPGSYGSYGYGGNFNANVNLPAAGSATGGTSYGGVSTVNPQATQADYQNLQGFADQAYEQAMRYLQPQMDTQNAALDQQLINQGIDPKSEYGRFMADQLGREQSDLLSKASFDALGFGQGIQNQYFNQAATRSGMANQMQQAQWQADLGYEAQDTARQQAELQYLANMANVGLGHANVGSDIYGNQLRYNLGMGELDMARAGMSFNQMMGLEDLAYRQWMANEDARRYDTNLIMQLAQGNPGYGGGGAPPNFSPGQGSATSPYDYWLDYLGTFGQKFGGLGGGGS